MKSKPTSLQQVNLLWKHRYAITVSAWIGCVYAERLVVDNRLWNKDLGFWNSMTDAAVFLTFLLTTLVTLLALLLRKSQITTWQASVRRLIIKVIKEIRHSLVLRASLLVLFVVGLIEGVASGSSIVKVVTDWMYNSIVEIWVTLKVPLFLVASLGFAYVVLRIIFNAMGKQTPKELLVSIQEWSVGTFLLTIVWAGYILLYYYKIWPKVPDTAQIYFAGGLLKDSFVYTVFAICMINGMYRFGHLASMIPPRKRWNAYAIFASFATVIAILCLVLDLLFLDKIEEATTLQYPFIYQRDILVQHVYIRDFVLLVPLAVLVFVWLLQMVPKQRRTERHSS
jgi:hypothetical protein